MMTRSDSEDDFSSDGISSEGGHGQIAFKPGHNRPQQQPVTFIGSAPSSTSTLPKRNTGGSSSAIHHRHSFTNLRQSGSSSLAMTSRESPPRVNGHVQSSSTHVYSSGFSRERERERDRYRSDHPPSYSETESADNAAAAARLPSSSQHPLSNTYQHHSRPGSSSGPASSSRPTSSSSNAVYSHNNTFTSGSSVLRTSASTSALASRSQAHARFLSNSNEGITSGDEPDSEQSLRSITTTPGVETETEVDEPVRLSPFPLFLFSSSGNSFSIS